MLQRAQDPTLSANPPAAERDSGQVDGSSPVRRGQVDRTPLRGRNADKVQVRAVWCRFARGGHVESGLPEPVTIDRVPRGAHVR